MFCKPCMKGMRSICQHYLDYIRHLSRFWLQKELCLGPLVHSGRSHYDCSTLGWIWSSLGILATHLDQAELAWKASSNWVYQALIDPCSNWYLYQGFWWFELLCLTQDHMISGKARHYVDQVHLKLCEYRQAIPWSHCNLYRLILVYPPF